MSHDERAFAPATARNREPILALLRELLPAQGLVLEIASGSGEHICHFARALPRLEFQPSDPDADARRSIAAWISSEGLANVRAPLSIAVEDEIWELDPAAALPVAILNVNMIHISPWNACEGLMRGAGRLLQEAAPLYLYGPYKREGRHTAPSNQAFDESLRARNATWGVRDLEAVIDCASRHGLAFERLAPMPANNLSLIFRARG